MASPASGDGNQSSPVNTLSAEERIIRSLIPPKKSFRRPPKFTNDPPPDVQLSPPRIKSLQRQNDLNPSTQPNHFSPNHSHADPPSPIHHHADQPPTSTASILSKFRQPLPTSVVVSEQEETSHEGCHDAANQPSLHEPAIMNLPADGNGSQPPPILPLTSKNEFPFLRRSQRKTRSKYKSQSPAIQPQQPPTSVNTANQPPSPSSSLQQQTPTLTSHDHLPTVEPSSPSNRTKPSQANTNQLPASSPQPTQAIHDHSGDDQPAVTAPMHSQNQPVLHGQFNQEPLQDATTVVKSSQPQPYPTQTTPTSQKVSHTCTRNSVHSQLQLLTADCQLPMQANTTESSEDQQTSQPKSLHACSSHEQTSQPKSLHACSSHEQTSQPKSLHACSSYVART